MDQKSISSHYKTHLENLMEKNELINIILQIKVKKYKLVRYKVFLHFLKGRILKNKI